MISQPSELTAQAILHYIDQHYAKRITPRHVASGLHYSLGHLTHVARRTLGASISDLIMQRRLAAAQRLLVETDLPVAQIAHAVGFRDSAYFTRRFTRATGSSPSQWRKAARSAEQRYRRCEACGTELPLLRAG